MEGWNDQKKKMIQSSKDVLGVKHAATGILEESEMTDVLDTWRVRMNFCNQLHFIHNIWYQER